MVWSCETMKEERIPTWIDLKVVEERSLRGGPSRRWTDGVKRDVQNSEMGGGRKKLWKMRWRVLVDVQTQE